MKRSLAIIVFLLVGIDILACLNLYVINDKGHEDIYNDEPPYEIRMYPQDDLESLNRYEKYIKDGQGKDQYHYISDYAVYLVKLGRSKEALPILQKLVRENPPEYELLANLATAYELNAYPDSAYKYMRKSLAINPGSHHYSEWFHLRILESVLQNRNKKSKIDEMNILKVDTSTNENIAYEISHQLNERIPLTSAPNAVLSKVIEESADFYKRIVSIDWSIKLYAIAAGYADNETTSARLWKKIEETRVRVVALNKKNKKAAKRDIVRKQLLSDNWKILIQADIDKWKNYKAHYEINLRILDL